MGSSLNDESNERTGRLAFMQFPWSLISCELCTSLRLMDSITIFHEVLDRWSVRESTNPEVEVTTLTTLEEDEATAGVQETQLSNLLVPFPPLEFALLL